MENEPVVSEGSRLSRSIFSVFDTISAWLVLAVAFLLPVFIVPGGAFAVEPAKKLLLGVGVSVAFALWIVSRLGTGSISFPRSVSIYALAGLPVAYLLSALFSGTIRHSLIGFGYETDTFASIAILSAFAFLGSIYFQKDSRVTALFNAIMAGAIVVFVVQVIHIAAPGSFIGDLFVSRTDTLVGKWNDSGLFYGLVLIIALLSREVGLPGKKYRVLSLLAFIVSLIGVVFVNLQILWIPLALFSFALVVYGMTNGFSGGFSLGLSTLKRPSTILFIVMLILALFGGAEQKLGKQLFALQNKLGLVTIEARPNREATTGIIKETLKEDAVLGVGPNNFDRQWRLFKPTAVNSSAFWNVDFKAGYGYLFSVPVVAGLLGVAVWMLFLGTWLVSGIRGAYRVAGSREHFKTAFAVLVVAIYLWVMLALYLPENVLIGYAFLFSGILVAVLASGGHFKNASIEFASRPRVRFVMVFGFVVLALTSLLGTYAFASRYLGSRLYQRALALPPGDVELASSLLASAIAKDGQALYYRGIADIGILRLNQIFASTGGSPDELRSRFQTVFAESLAAAQKAIAINPQDYLNHVSLGRLYETLVPAKVEGAEASAKKAYNAALALNDKNPAVYLHLARLSYTTEDEKAARDYIAKGLALKANFTELHFLLSQIEAQSGNTDAAISSALKAVELKPSDIGAWFQLGLLYYTDKDYTKAAAALEQAVLRDTNYSNARYFLGLSYDRLGKSEDAIAQFERIKVLNPDNEEVKKILSNLNAGRAALANIGGTAPEKRTTPPVDDTR